MICHEATSSPHWRVTLAPSAASAKLAARLAIFLEARQPKYHLFFFSWFLEVSEASSAQPVNGPGRPSLQEHPRFQEDCGQPMACDQLEGFCKKNPAFRDIVECGNLRRFCEKHPGLLLYEALSKETDKVKLPKHCCLFLRGICNFDAHHGNYLHANPLPAVAWLQSVKQPEPEV